jgi:hypothetical protein
MREQQENPPRKDEDDSARFQSGKERAIDDFV